MVQRERERETNSPEKKREEDLPFLVVMNAGSDRISLASVPCTAKSAMMTPLIGFSHKLSKISRENPD